METQSSCLHIAMCPWFAFGHITQYLHISNKLAQNGYKISFFVPTKTHSKLQHFNHFPHLITFVPIAVPLVDGLPPEAETTADVPPPLIPLIMTAMDRAEPDFELLLRTLKPHLVFYDLAYWIPKLARRLGIKSVHFSIINVATTGFEVWPGRKLGEEDTITTAELTKPPPGYPDPSVRLPLHLARLYAEMRRKRFGSGVQFADRIFISVSDSDILLFKGCAEIDGAEFAEYVEQRFEKPLFFAGPIIPAAPAGALEENLAGWLGSFERSSVVYCALGLEWALEMGQFQELLLGLELSGRPFLAVVRPPRGAGSIEEALPVGFLERVGGRAAVRGGWVQQQMVLAHPAIGCFVTHCGSGSLAEAVVNTCQLVMIPHINDHFLQARMIGNRLRAGVEVERGDQDGLFTRESVCRAIRTVMDDGDGSDEVVGREIRANRSKLQKLLLNEDLEAAYIDGLCQKLQSLIAT